MKPRRTVSNVVPTTSRRRCLPAAALLTLVVGCGSTEGAVEWSAPDEPQPAPAEENENQDLEAVPPDPAPSPFAHDPIFEALERVNREFAGNHGEPLPAFAAKCDLATGIHVPDFNCSAGTLVPTTNFSGGSYPFGTCDRPNRLNSACDPGSRFQIVAKNAAAVAVAHCRKTGLPGNLYSDIAVIQYNKVNGATCYYQALSSAGLDGNFKSPSLGTSLADQADMPNPTASPWKSNFTTKGIDCRRCHDNGAIIRSPYLAQLTGTNALPGAGDNNYNKTNPVSFIGTDYQGWRLYSVQTTTVCTTCHRMGVSNTPGGGQGTARDLGIRATAMSETAKNPHSPTSPIWMTPTAITYNASNATFAAVTKACADEYRAGNPLPGGCTIAEITTPFRGLTPASAVASLSGL